MTYMLNLPFLICDIRALWHIFGSQSTSGRQKNASFSKCNVQN